MQSITFLCISFVSALWLLNRALLQIVFTLCITNKFMNNVDAYMHAKQLQKRSFCISFAKIKENFNQDSLLQSKKIVSGEISKEPFLDILLTDSEQSSFSLIFQDQGASQEEVRLPGLKTSSYLFKKTGFLNPNSKSCLVKSFLAYNAVNTRQDITSFRTKANFGPYASDLNIKQNRKNKNINVISFFARGERTRESRVATAKYNEVILYQHFVQETLQRKLGGKLGLNTFTNRDSLQKSRQISCLVRIGDYVHCGDKIGYLSETPIVMSESGKILRISQTQITIQKMQPVLFVSQAEIHVENNEWVKRGTPILTLTHQTLVTGDIVQGIPRIEQLFEASTAAPPGAALQDFGSPSDNDSSKKASIDDCLRSHHSSHLLPLTSSFMGVWNGGLSEQDLENTLQNRPNNDQINESSGIQSPAVPKLRFGTAGLSYSTVDSATGTQSEASLEKPMFLYNTLQSQVRETFRKKWDQFPLPVAVRQSLEEIQQVIVESIQKVYISQGVLIADKHIEIIVRQMTSKAQVFDGGSTGLLIDEILSLQQIENANISTPGQKALYLPVIMGLTRAALSSDSFVSAASFQETTRVLSRDAVAGKTDFLRGLKEKVIIGDLIDAGTGLDAFYIYSLFSKKIFENKFREILNRKVTHKTLKKLVLTAALPQQI